MRSRTGRAIGTLMLGTLLSKILGFVRELTVAYKFGAGSITDAFVLTNGIPTVLFSAIAIAVSINYIPVYVGLSDRNSKNVFTSKLINIYAIVLLAGCLIMIAFPKAVLFIFASGLTGESKHYSVVMLRIMAISAVPIILSGIFQAYSQAEDRFVSTSLYGIIVNTIIIVTTIVVLPENYFLLSVGTVLANFCGMFYVAHNAHRCGYRYSFNFRFRDDKLKELFLLTLPLLVENIASNLSGIVDKNLASYLQDGIISGLNYANTLGNIASSVIASAIITATFPMNSRLINDGDADGFKSNFIKYAKILIYILLPISGFMFFDAAEIVKVVFERGAFDATATNIVAECMMFYALGTTFGGLQTYLVRGFYAMKETKTPVKVMVFSLICNMVVNVLLVFSLRHKGIALSTSLSYLIAVELLLILLKKRCGINVMKLVNCELVKVIAVVGSVASVVYAINRIGLCVMNLYLSFVINGMIYVAIYIITMLVVSSDFRCLAINVLNKLKKNEG